MPPLFSLALLILLSAHTASLHAHDPGLSMVNVDLSADNNVAHLTYAVKDLEQFVQMDKDFQEGVSEQEFAQAKDELHQFLVAAIEFSDGSNKIQVVITDIYLDSSDAVHVMIMLPAISETEFTVYSRMIDRFALGHRQFVSVKTPQEIVSSRILSAREPKFKVNLPQRDFLGVFTNFAIEGIWHIWIGFDHILFVVTLLLPALLVLKGGFWYPQAEFKRVFIQTVKVISAFTIAHSLTLALTVLNIISLPGRAVESIIAASVIVAAGNNIFTWVKGRLWVLAFVFGLIHGMGFASVLRELGMPIQTKTLALIGFNLGVELGQLAIITVLLPGLYFFRKQRLYRPVLMQSGSWVIVLIASGWLFERSI